MEVESYNYHGNRMKTRDALECLKQQLDDDITQDVLKRVITINETVLTYYVKINKLKKLIGSKYSIYG